MNKTTATICLLLMLLTSCNKADRKDVKIKTPTSSPAMVADSSKCDTAKFEIWSKIKKRCVNFSKEATQLNPYPYDETKVPAAYVFFDGDRAELYFSNEKSTRILVRESEGSPFINGDWQLIPWKGYVLKQGDTIRYIGQ